MKQQFSRPWSTQTEGQKSLWDSGYKVNTPGYCFAFRIPHQAESTRPRTLRKYSWVGGMIRWSPRGERTPETRWAEVHHNLSSECMWRNYPSVTLKERGSHACFHIDLSVMSVPTHKPRSLESSRVSALAPTEEKKNPRLKRRWSHLTNQKEDFRM